jgi:hypothetical protein
MAKKLKRLSKSAFLDLVSDHLGVARQLLQADGYLDMMIVWVTSDGTIFITGSYTEPLIRVEQLHEQGRHEEAYDLKNAIWSDVREHLERQKAIGYFTISDAFVGMQKLEKGAVAFGEEPGQILLPDVTLPRFDPKRREAIMVNWEWKGPPEGVYTSGSVRQFYRREGSRIIIEETERTGSPVGGSQEGMLR